MRRIPKTSRSRLSSVLPGACLRLKEGFYRQLRDREWIFNRAEEQLIFLIHASGAYGVVVKEEAIYRN
jgi:hypothetical protein